jgi:hypothetical protein
LITPPVYPMQILQYAWVVPFMICFYL